MATYDLVCIHTYIHACMHTYIHAYMHTCIRAYIHTYIHAYMHTCIHTYIHTYIHTCIHTCPSPIHTPPFPPIHRYRSCYTSSPPQHTPQNIYLSTLIYIYCLYLITSFCFVCYIYVFIIQRPSIYTSTYSSAATYIYI